MPRRPAFSLLLTVVAALLISACGSDTKAIPDDEAEALLSELNALQEEIGANLCGDADRTLTKLGLAVTDLGGGVDREVRDGLTRLVGHLDSLIGQCSESEPPTTTTSETTETTTTTTETTTSDSTDSTETETETETDPTTTTDTTTTDSATTAPPPDGGSGGAGPSGKE